MRGKQAVKRKIPGDVRYNDTDIAKFINYIMMGGKKAIDIIKKESQQDPRHIFNKALKKISPLLEVRGRRIGGANYQIPYQVRGDRRFTLGCRWLIEITRARKGKPMAIKLAEEVMAAANGEGAVIKKKEMVHKTAEANKAFAHFAR